jgi:hypothetical protein
MKWNPSVNGRDLSSRFAAMWHTVLRTANFRICLHTHTTWKDQLPRWTETYGDFHSLVDSLELGTTVTSR